MESIRELCEINTYLNDSDVDIIENISEMLQFISDLVKEDVFIDCPSKDKDEAIVVAHARPSYCKSLYKNVVVGQMALRSNEPAVLRTLEIGMPTRDLKAVTQESIMVTQTVEPIKNKKNETIGVVIIEKDTTENLSDTKKLKILSETNEVLTDILTKKEYGNSKLKEQKSDAGNISYHIDDAIIIFDEDGFVRFNNPVAEELYRKLGYKDDLLGMDFSNISLNKSSFKEVVKNNTADFVEVSIGQLVLSVKYIVQMNKSFKLVMMIKDITDMKQKEKELILKSVAIKEIHHRVKNNLQTIASLLRLQARRVENEEFKNALNESMNRILSMAATHEILAKQGIDEVNIKEVILKVKSSIIQCYNIESRNIKISISGDDFTIDSDKSTSIALVINELLQNCLDHAFKKQEKGNIAIVIHKGKRYCTISVVDDGIGFDINEVKNSSLGLNIVKSLVKEKIGGNLNIYSNPNDGTKVVFDFKFN